MLETPLSNSACCFFCEKKYVCGYFGRDLVREEVEEAASVVPSIVIARMAVASAHYDGQF